MDGEDSVPKSIEHMFEDAGKENLVRETLILPSMVCIKILKEKGRVYKDSKVSAVRDPLKS